MCKIRVIVAAALLPALCFLLLSCEDSPVTRKANADVVRWAFLARSEDFGQSLEGIEKTLADKLGWTTQRIEDATVKTLKREISADQKDRDYKLFFYYGDGGGEQVGTDDGKPLWKFYGPSIDGELYKPEDVPADRDYTFVFLCCCLSAEEPAASKFFAAFNTDKKTPMAYLGFNGKIGNAYAHGWASALFKELDGNNTLNNYLVEHEYEDPGNMLTKPEVSGDKFIKIDGI